MGENAYPDNNPKSIVGIKKVPLHLVPPVATAFEAMALKDGAAKYGPYNWRDNNVAATVYISACKRHIDAWFDGEESAADSGVHHLAHARACLAIILDAMTTQSLIDDRPSPGASAKLQADLMEKDDVPYKDDYDAMMCSFLNDESDRIPTILRLPDDEIVPCMDCEHKHISKWEDPCLSCLDAMMMDVHPYLNWAPEE